MNKEVWNRVCSGCSFAWCSCRSLQSSRSWSLSSAWAAPGVHKSLQKSCSHSVMTVKISLFAAVANTSENRDLIWCLWKWCSFSGDLPGCSLSVSAVRGRTEALTRWFPTRSYWGAGRCWWVWSWGIFQCSECHILSPWTPRWKWDTTTCVDKPWVAHGRAALIQKCSVFHGGGREVSCFCRMHPWAGVHMRIKVPKKCFWGLYLLCCTSFVRFWYKMTFLCFTITVLRHTQALTKGVTTGSHPHAEPKLPSAASPAFWISCVFCGTQLGSGPSLQGCSWLQVPQLAEHCTEPNENAAVIMT